MGRACYPLWVGNHGSPFPAGPSLTHNAFLSPEPALSRIGTLRAPTEEERWSPLVAADSLLEHAREDMTGLLPGEFISLSPPHEALDYHFGLEEGEGIRDLFDCDFGDLTPLDF